MIPHITKALWDAYDAYQAALKEEKETDEKVTPLLDKLAKDFAFEKKVEVNGEVIEEGVIDNAEDIYLATEEECNRFCEAADSLYKELGYNIEKNYCPVLISRKERIDAMHKFIDASFYLVKGTGLDKQSLYGNMNALKEYCERTVALLETIRKG